MLAFSIGVLISKNAFFSKALQKIPKVKSRFSITGKPILGALKDEQMIMIATLMFLAVFYTPKDIFYCGRAAGATTHIIGGIAPWLGPLQAIFDSIGEGANLVKSAGRPGLDHCKQYLIP